MPLYEYECTENGHRFDVSHAVGETPALRCDVCGSTQVRKRVTAPAFHLKGGGWYKDGYASAAANGNSTEPKSGAKSATEKTKSESPSAPEAKTKTENKSKAEN